MCRTTPPSGAPRRSVAERSKLRRELGRLDAVHDVDPLKLVVDLTGTGADGFEVERDLRGDGIVLEMADRTTLVPLLTIPPGVPAIAPGELLTTELLDALRDEANAGSRMAGASDPTLETLLVVRA
jgi:arginine/lysine/ornithine decarboxylase